MREGNEKLKEFFFGRSIERVLAAAAVDLLDFLFFLFFFNQILQ